MYTPGHTDDSYSYLMGDRVFTGDTLLIRGTGRTDFQNGERARAIRFDLQPAPASCRTKRMVFPAHDYKGDTVSTIGEEKRYNPRLQVKSVDEYVELMNNLNLPNPKMMDVAVPANMQVGLQPGRARQAGLGADAAEAIAGLGGPDMLLVDLRESSERAKHGADSGRAACALSGDLRTTCSPAACCARCAAATGRRVVFFCAFGERSAMAVAARKPRPCQHKAWSRAHDGGSGRRPGGSRVMCRRHEDKATKQSILPRGRCMDCFAARNDGITCLP